MKLKKKLGLTIKKIKIKKVGIDNLKKKMKLKKVGIDISVDYRSLWRAGTLESLTVHDTLCRSYLDETIMIMINMKL